MKANKNTVDGIWLELRGDIQKAWGQLTNDELDKTKGDYKSISGLIQQRYGKEQDRSGKKLSEIYDRFNVQKEKTVAAIKNSLK